MSAAAFKATLSQFKITLLTALVLCFFNAGSILGDGQARWFQALNALMEYDRALILKGEIWRLFTGHLVHWSAEHFYLDALVFVAQGIVFEPKIGRAYAQVLGIAGGAIGLALLLLQSDLAAYRGISGLINTQLVLGTGLFVFDPNLKRSIKGFYMAVLSVHMFKIAYETVFKVPFFVTDALGDMGLFTPLAHLGGVMVGLYYLLGSIRTEAKARPRIEMPKCGFTPPGPSRD
ncbi:MAG: rhombosortase [Desulfobacterales bacterium]|nr:rhombosortase [Desulfobacterales bacterium]